MALYLNPSNSNFTEDSNRAIYVDKTELIAVLNRKIGTGDKFICNSRPRRFGKSMAANMLAAYYSRGCDSSQLFARYKIAHDESFRKHLNQYDVIHIDVQWCRCNVQSAGDVVPYVQKHVLRELTDEYPNILTDHSISLAEALALVNEKSGHRFVIIIDEWDSIIRDDTEDTAAHDIYINFLRSLLKGNLPSGYLCLAYLTGILPIKKVKTQSALNNFDEFTMLDAGELAPFVGFTQQEVMDLCQKYNRNFDDMKLWYDGYLLEENLPVYNPRAVVSSIKSGKLKSYWSQTGSYEVIAQLINMNFDGLKSAVIHMLSGESLRINTKSYQNDMISFRNKDDVLTLLIHLGYLAYDEKTSKAFIPNEEIRSEFVEAVEDNNWTELTELQIRSEKLLQSTLSMDCAAVAEAIEAAHMNYASVIQYNDENALSCVISMAYYSAVQYYYLPIREFPAGKGFADLVFLPKKERPELPALLIELKWNKSAETAIRQIKDRKYVESIKHFSGNLLCVGINYDKKTKKHTCDIEKMGNGS